MKVLVIGNGGREHALVWKISQSPLVKELHCSPSNPGIREIATGHDVAADDISGLASLADSIAPDLVVVGPEIPLALGITDALESKGIAVFGPSQKAAQIEASKGFSKDIMRKYGVPTARYGRFTQKDEAIEFLNTMEAPYVLKADGLAAGKGVVISKTLEEAQLEVSEMLSGKFGEASAELVIEEFMEGQEVSIFALTDGNEVVYLPSSQDHKRVGEGDTGLNTGGMGVYSPLPGFDAELLERIHNEITKPTLKGMKQEGALYKGVLYIGIMLTDIGPKVVEFNCRFGDPECQPLMFQMESDIVPTLKSIADGMLNSQTHSLGDPLKAKAVANIVMAAKGYPASYQKGTIIKGIDKANAMEDVVVFHAGTTEKDGNIVANGGRVLNVIAKDDTLKGAIAKAYEAVDVIDWPDGFCRRDIGWRVTA